MKKTIIYKILSVLLLAVVFAPSLSLALLTPPDRCRMRETIPANIASYLNCPPPPANECIFTSGRDCLSCCSTSLIYYIVTIIFVAVIAISVIFLIIAGYNFITGSGDQAKIRTARNMVLYAVVGIAVAIIARVAPTLIYSLLFGVVGGSGGGPGGPPPPR